MPFASLFVEDFEQCCRVVRQRVATKDAADLTRRSPWRSLPKPNYQPVLYLNLPLRSLNNEAIGAQLV